MSLGECIEKGCIAKGWLVLDLSGNYCFDQFVAGERKKEKEGSCLSSSFVCFFF